MRRVYDYTGKLSMCAQGNVPASIALLQVVGTAVVGTRTCARTGRAISAADVLLGDVCLRGLYVFERAFMWRASAWPMCPVPTSYLSECGRRRDVRT